MSADVAERDGAPPRIPRGLTLLSIASVVGAFVSPLTLGISAIPAAILLAIAVILARRGYHVRRFVVCALVSLAITFVAITTWQRFFLSDAEVTGSEVIRHDRVEDSFDTAFGKAQAPPPGKKSDAADSGALGDDAGFNIADDAGR
jgi:hypothetical protein